MSKFQDLFKDAEGGKILDTKFTLKLESLPDTPVDKQTAKGGTVKVFNVVLSKDGEQYEWEMNPDQKARIFTKTKKGSGEVLWEAKEGDLVNIWYASPSKPGAFAYFAAESADGNSQVVNTASAANDVFLQKPRFVKKGAPAQTPAGETKWDGTPRLGNFRAGYAGLLQAILSNPNVNPFSDEQVMLARGLAEREMLHARSRSKELEESTQD